MMTSISLEDFIRTFWGEVTKADLKPVFMRGYEKLPPKKIGGDIDIFVHRDQLDEVLNVIRSIEPVRIVNFTWHSWVLNLFLAGVKGDNTTRYLQIDIIFRLTAFGVSFLDEKQYLDAAQNYGSSRLKIPSPLHEAITIFLSGYIVGGGALKEKYYRKIDSLDAHDRQAFQKHLQESLGNRHADSICAWLFDGHDKPDYKAIRRALWLRAAIKNPFKVAWGKIVHNVSELWAYYQNPVFRLVFLGYDGSGKSTTIEGFKKSSFGLCKAIAHYYMRHSLLLKTNPNTQQNAITTAPHSLQSRNAFMSMVKAAVYWLDSWLGLMCRYRTARVEIYDRHFYDMLCDRKRYVYGGPIWFLKMLCRLLPQPDLVVYCWAPAAIAYERKREIAPEELEQLDRNYRSLPLWVKSFYVLNTHFPAHESLQCLHEQVTSAMAKKANKRLKL